MDDQCKLRMGRRSPGRIRLGFSGKKYQERDLDAPRAFHDAP